LDRITVAREDQRVGDRIAFLFEERHSSPDHGSIRFVNRLGCIEHRRKDIQSAGGLEGREMDDAVFWDAGSGEYRDIGAQLAKLIDEREPGLSGHRPTLRG
jgi:hypothetical protein